MLSSDESDRVNGYPVVAQALLPDVEGLRNGRSIIMVDRGGGRYAVGTHIKGFSGWNHGDYCNGLAEAQEAFTRRWTNG